MLALLDRLECLGLFAGDPRGLSILTFEVVKNDVAKHKNEFVTQQTC